MKSDYKLMLYGWLNTLYGGVFVIAGVSPTDLLVQEKKTVYKTKEKVDAQHVRTDAKALIRQRWKGC